MFTIQRHCSGSVRKEPEGVQVPLRERETALRFRAKGTSERVKFPYVRREPQRESSSLTCKGNLKESPPTPASSYTHAREPRLSALSTRLPLRPSNYQSEGRRRPAAQSGLSSTRDGSARAAALYATRHDGALIKLLIFSTRKFINLLNLQSTIHPLHIKFIQVKIVQSHLI